MSKKPQFKSIDLDQLIDSVTTDIDDLTNDITSYDEHDVAAPTSPQITNLVQKENAGTTVDFQRVYAQLERLIENGNTALTTLNSIDIDVLSPETIAATTSLINAIKNCMTEFTKIHLNHVKFIQKLKYSEIEQRNKIELLKKKAQLYNSKNGNNVISNNQNGQQMLEVNRRYVLRICKISTGKK